MIQSIDLENANIFLQYDSNNEIKCI